MPPICLLAESMLMLAIPVAAIFGCFVSIRAPHCPRGAPCACRLRRLDAALAVALKTSGGLLTGPCSGRSAICQLEAVILAA
jgi:hypothetical protein